jgi:phenylpropionate dioxygenase-like ring-hydroxylating dioxygenase large terminal subunit
MKQPGGFGMGLEGWSLPVWTYRDPDFFALETARIFRPSWQIVGHESDLPKHGDYLTIDYLGENVLLIRGEDGTVRAFTNVCRHRGARIIDGASGCAKRLTCPYHGWTYDSAGRLTGVPGRAGYGELDMARLGLTSIQVENFHGFLFVRLEDDGGPSVAEMLAPYAAEISGYRFDQLRALGRVTLRPRAVNWKIIGENYCDVLHIGVAHPGLKRLFGESYRVEASEHACRMSGTITARPSSNATERAYQHFLPEAPHLPPERQRLWTYIQLWPNMAFDIYPDQIDFMQWLPVSPTQTLIREIAYAIPDQRREMRAARYLNWRINRQVNVEDRGLIERVQAGLGSLSFSTGPVSEEEVALRHFHARMRWVYPETLGDEVSRLRSKRMECGEWGMPTPGPSPKRQGR